MDPVTMSALITGGAAVASAGANFFGQRQANKANINSAREQMRFQENMSSTAHQRQMQDMRLAGLNPMLSSKLGGASTPGGASAVSQDEFGKASSSAIDAVRTRAELAKLKADTVIADTAAKYADFKQAEELFIAKQQWNLLKAQVAATNTSALESVSRIKAINAALPRTIADAKFYSGKGGDISRVLGLVGQGASTALDVKNLLTPKFDSGKYFWGSKSTGEIFNP